MSCVQTYLICLPDDVFRQRRHRPGLVDEEGVALSRFHIEQIHSQAETTAGIMV